MSVTWVLFKILINLSFAGFSDILNDPESAALDIFNPMRGAEVNTIFFNIKPPSLGRNYNLYCLSIPCYWNPHSVTEALWSVSVYTLYSVLVHILHIWSLSTTKLLHRWQHCTAVEYHKGPTWLSFSQGNLGCHVHWSGALKKSSIKGKRAIALLCPG